MLAAMLFHIQNTVTFLFQRGWCWFCAKPLYCALLLVSAKVMPKHIYWMLYLLLALLQLSVQVTNAAKWSTEEINRSTAGATGNPVHAARSVNISVSDHFLCSMDRINLQWKSSQTCDIDDLSMAIVRVGAADGITVPLVDTVVQSENIAFEQSVSELIRCDTNSDHCIPKISSITAQSEDLKLVLTFDQKTTQIILSNATAISNALHMVPMLQLDGAYAMWAEPTRLEIKLSQSDLNVILLAHSTGEKIEFSPRSQPRLEQRGSVTVRPTEPGDYEVVIIDHSANKAILSAHEAAPQLIHVQLCDDATVLPKLPSAHKIDLRTGNVASSVSSVEGGLLRQAVHAKRTVQVQGPVAITGLDPMKYAHHITDPQNSGTWSVSCWMRLLQGPTGQYRAFLHKGSTDGATRTPSVWLMPQDNRLSVRVSTAANADIGAESISEIPTDKWTFVTIVFTNHTSNIDRTDSAAYAADATAPDVFPRGVQVTSPDDEYYQNVAAKQAALLSRTAVKTGSVEKAQPEYSIAVYFDGKLDAKMDFSDVVIANNHSAHFFNDVSFAGPKALLADFTIWDNALSADEVNAMYLSNAPKSHYFAADQAVSVFRHARSPFVHPFTSTTTSATSDTQALPLPDASDDGDAESALFHPHIPADPIVPILLERARTSLEACESYEARVDLYAEAAERGSAEALYKWALLIKQGAEVVNTACGVDSSGESSASSGGSASTANSLTGGLWSSLGGKKATAARAFEQERTTMAMLMAADQGYAPALVSLAFTLLNGGGVEPILKSDQSYSTDWNIPVHPAFTTLDPATGRRVYRQSLLQAAMGRYLRIDAAACSNACAKSANATFDLSASRENDIFGSVLIVNLTNATGKSDINEKCVAQCPNPTDLALGMLQLAAVHRVAEAQQVLAHRYKHGLGVKADEETAAAYLRYPASLTAQEFHRVGAQAIVESDRIDDTTAPEIGKGNQGNDDELIQHQKVRAREGHLPSILAMADLYYYGAHGLPRDQPRALRYFEQAAAAGDPAGLCGAAGMYLKGEGAPANVSRAIELYENASSTGSIRALNGLGYMYFFGQSVEKNQTKALEYFLAAAVNETDADSLFNAAHCLENGLGAEKDLPRAVKLYSVAANKLGNFNSIHVLANMYLEGRGVPRSASTALQYFSSATAIGPWAGWLRRGFDQYLHGQYERSAGAYLHAGELGYEISQSNAAYVYRTKLTASTEPNPFLVVPPASSNIDPTCAVHSDGTDTQSCSGAVSGDVIKTEWGDAHIRRERLLARLYALSAHHGNRESYLHLGTCFFKGTCGVGAVDYRKAQWYYSKASAMGLPLSSAYLGVMHHYGLGVGINLVRAARYYDLALAQGADQTVAVMIQSLKYAMSMKGYFFLAPVNVGLEYVVRALWKA